jgi:hypothetical protein
MTTPNTISFTRSSLLRFTKLYNQERDSEAFFFQGSQFLPSYARYLIEYLAGQLEMRFQIDGAGFIELRTGRE